MKDKEHVNYKLINITLFVFIIYLLNKLNVLNKILDLVVLILLSFILSYVVYPIYKKISQKFNKYLSVIIIYGVLFLIIIFLLYLVIPSDTFILEVTDLFNNIIKFVTKINIQYDLNLNIDLYLNKVINYIINNGFFLIKNIFNFFTKLIFIFILSICVLFNINYLKTRIKKLKYRELFYNINTGLKDYVIANLKIILIQVIEYTIVFYLIGHPNYLLLGMLNSFNSFIPIFGSLITNVIAVTTASVIILTGIVSILFPNIDAYLITPKIYKSTNKISQTLSISIVIIGGVLFGFYGIFFALPSLIIIIEVIKYKKSLKKAKNML